MWTKSDGGHRVTTAHLVNYYTPIPTKAEFAGDSIQLGGPPEQFAPKILRDITVRLRVGLSKVSSINAYDPDAAAPVALQYTQAGDTVRFQVPYVRTYQIVQIKSE